MSRPRIVIVGGGLAGLSAGCHALGNGWETTIVEHNLGLGGVCTSWTRGDYVVDGCIHWLTGGPFARIYDELHITRRVPVRPLDEFFTSIDVTTGHRVVLARDPERLRRELRSIAPDDGDAIDEMLAGAARISELSPPIDRPTEIESTRDRLADLWAIRHQIPALLHFRETVGAWCSGHLRSGALRALLGRVVGDDVPMIILLMVLGYLGRGWLSRPVGGTAAFRDALIDRYVTLGGAARVHTTVEEIIVSGDRARGVRLTDGTTIDADVVVSAASSPETLLRLLGGRYGAGVLRERLETWPLIDPIVQISFGVAAPMRDVPSTLLLSGLPDLEVGGRHSSHLYVRVFNEEPGFAPPGHTVVQVLLPTDYDWWASRGTHYGAAKDAVATAVQAQLAVHLPAMAGAVRMVDVATPLTYWRQTRSWRGAYEGWKPTAGAMWTHVDKRLPGLAGLYMAGQWVEPGGGVPAAIMSGRQAIQIACSDAGLPFVVPAP